MNNREADGGRPSDGVKAGRLIEDDLVPPEEVFSILQNHIRLAILRTLWQETDTASTYTELKQQTPIETDNFHYHLEQLVGHFVRRTDYGYELLYAGEAVIRAIIAGLINRNVYLPWVELDTPCPFCGGVVELRYDDDQVSVRCTRCAGVIRDEQHPSGTILSYGFPPSGVVGRSPDELFEVAQILYDAKVTPMLQGVCPECAARVNQSLTLCEDHHIADDGICHSCQSRFPGWVACSCDLCGYTRQFAPWFKLLTEPAVIAFYHDHTDFDLRIPFNKFTWENAPYINAISQIVDSTDPFRLRFEISVAEAELIVMMDEALEIVGITRHEF